MDRKELINKIIEVKPSTRQKSIQRENFNAFVHYGINTFADKEWSDGTLAPEIFNPSDQDVEQWVKVLKYAGAYGIIFTAKHHDGFCLWQTNTTEYSIKNSPYKGGKGDVVKELADACKKYAMKFGLYLSPWDRNSKLYGTPQYDDYYCDQLTELLTKYGDIFAIWLDGACGATIDGKSKQKYDFQRYYALIRRLSPKTIISNCGPDVRWVGNENGLSRSAEWNVIPRLEVSEDSVMSKSQQTEKQNMKLLKEKDMLSEDVGSVEFLENYDEFVWSPAEVDVSIRPGWFYHKSQDYRLRSLRNLLKIYYSSVGGNSLLLLNVPVDKTGRVNDKDVSRLIKFGDRIKKDFSVPVLIKDITAPRHEGANKIRNVIQYVYNKNSYDATSYYTPEVESDSYTINIKLDGIYKVDKIRLVENVAFSQRVEEYVIKAKVKDKWVEVYKGETIGYNRIAKLKRAILTEDIEITINKCRSKPYIEHIGIYEKPGK